MLGGATMLVVLVQKGCTRQAGCCAYMHARSSISSIMGSWRLASRWRLLLAYVCVCGLWV
jgi:hypothetical protein